MIVPFLVGLFLIVGAVIVASWNEPPCQYCNDDGLPCLQCGAGRRKKAPDA